MNDLWADNDTEESPYVPSVPYHITFGNLIRTLSHLPQHETIYAADGSYEDFNGETFHCYPRFRFDRSEWAEWDVVLDTVYQNTPVTVGDFLEYLMECLDEEIDPGNSSYTITEDCYVWLSGNDAGAINGIRLNHDESYTISTKDPARKIY